MHIKHINNNSYLCRKYPKLWDSIQSLVIYGTTLASSQGMGINVLLKLGLANLYV